MNDTALPTQSEYEIEDHSEESDSEDTFFEKQQNKKDRWIKLRRSRSNLAEVAAWQVYRSGLYWVVSKQKEQRDGVDVFRYYIYLYLGKTEREAYLCVVRSYGTLRAACAVIRKLYGKVRVAERVKSGF